MPAGARGLYVLINDCGRSELSGLNARAVGSMFQFRGLRDVTIYSEGIGKRGCHVCIRWRWERFAFEVAELFFVHVPKEMF